MHGRAKHSEVVESVCLHRNVPIMHNSHGELKIRLIEDQNSSSIFLFFWSLKFLLKNYQSSCFTKAIAIIWSVLIKKM